MGNRAKRVRLARLLKQRGLGRLYTKSKMRAYRLLRGRWMDDLAHYLSFGPGDLVNDCDCFNHIIKSYRLERRSSGTFWADHYEFEDGRWSCGCPSGVEPAKSREEIEQGHLRELWESWDKDQSDWLNDESRAMLEKLRRGEHICDERGIKLP